MGEIVKIVLKLERLLGGWDFNYTDARGRSRGLISEWRARVLPCSNILFFDSGLGTILFS